MRLCRDGQGVQDHLALSSTHNLNRPLATVFAPTPAQRHAHRHLVFKDHRDAWLNL
jgi:hypothetical protein